jgi:hypothetical protein
MKQLKVECISLSEMMSHQDLIDSIASPALSEINTKTKKKRIIKKYKKQKHNP